MKNIAKMTLIVSLNVTLAGAAFAGPGGKGPNCGAIGGRVQAASSDDPAAVLGIVESEVGAAESCACEIVKAAILGSKADNATVGDIVYTAVTASPGMASTIAECAIAVAPGAAAEIKAALKRALEGGEGFAKAPVDIRGIYLIPPVSPSAAAVDAQGGVLEVIREIIQRIGDRGGSGTGTGGTPSTPDRT